MSTRDSRSFLTTSETAKLFGVSRFTILNWIRERKLKASQTAGHHHRILKTDLLKFMNQLGIYPSKPSEESGEVMNCWEYARLNHMNGHECAECLVYKEQMNRCYLTVPEFGPEKVRCGQRCLDCEYLNAFFPEKRAAVKKKRERAVQTIQILPTEKPHHDLDEKQSFAERIYKAGQYLGVIKKNFSGIKIGNRKK